MALQLKPEILQHPPIPRPLQGLSPRKILGREWWRNTKKLVLERDGPFDVVTGESFKGREHLLQGHEIYRYNFQTGLGTFADVCLLSRMTHEYFHLGRTLSHVIAKKNNWIDDNFVKCFHHGRDILDQANLEEHYSRVFIYAKFLKYFNVYKYHEEFDHAHWLFYQAQQEGRAANDFDVPWHRWRLDIYGKLYMPIDESYRAYINRYRKN